MRDPATVYTKRGTPIILIVSRLLFGLYFALLIFARAKGYLDGQALGISWLMYLAGILISAEYVYASFLKKNIDLTFAFPLLLAVYVLHGVSLLVRGQEQFPIINRAEHFTSFILMGYIVWVFFLKYLPQQVWQRHPYYTALLVLSITSLAGVMNEIIELFFDVTFHTKTIGGGFDTPLDLLMNTLGTGLFLAVQLILNTSAPSDQA